MSGTGDYRVTVRRKSTEHRETLAGAAWHAARHQKAGYQVVVVHRDETGLWTPVDWEPHVPPDRSVFYVHRTVRLPRVEWAPVAAVLQRRAGKLDLPVSAMARELDVHPKQVYRWMQLGIRVREADRVADHLEIHPAELWVDYYEVAAVADDDDELAAA